MSPIDPHQSRDCHLTELLSWLADGDLGTIKWSGSESYKHFLLHHSTMSCEEYDLIFHNGYLSQTKIIARIIDS